MHIRVVCHNNNVSQFAWIGILSKISAAKILTDLDGAIVFGPLHPIEVGAYSRCVSQ